MRSAGLWFVDQEPFLLHKMHVFEFWLRLLRLKLQFMKTACDVVRLGEEAAARETWR